MSTRSLHRKVVSTFAALLATGGIVATGSSPAAAETINVTNVTFEWTGSGELQAAPPAGGSNTFVAGESDGSQATYKASEGNVSIWHVAPDGTETAPTWDTRHAHVSSDIDQVVRLSRGTGTIDTDGSGTISWDGDWSINFYGGFVPFTVVDPVLSVDADGNGELTADLVGYASSMDNPSVKVPLPPVVDVTIATFDGVNLNADGTTTIEPDYEGVEVEVGSATPQNRTSEGWGSWPQEFVDYHLDTGLSSYWYSSGGAADSLKAPNPFTVEVGDPTPTVTVSDTVANANGTTTVTITGTGFDPDLAEATRAPICAAGPPAPCDRPGGAYITFGKFAENWKPSDGNAASTRVGTGTKWAVTSEYVDTIGGTAAGAVVLNADGSFTTEITLDKPTLDAAVEAASDPSALVNYGIYTYPGAGATQPLYETYTPITFEAPFTDIAGIHFEPEITWLSSQGITTGYDNGDGTFSYQPSGQVLREQMAAFLYRYENDGANPADGAPTAEFTDVPSSHVFNAHIAWLAETGITTGYADGTFRPGQPVLREQMAAFLYRLAGEPAFEAPATSPFADLSTSHTFYKEITWLASTGITTGYEEANGTTTFRGSQPVLREQMAAFLNRYDNLGS